MTKTFFKTELRVLRVTGDKAGVFLHGQFTNSIKDLPAGRGNYNLLLTQKGKVRADLHVINEGGSFALVVAGNFSELVIEHLRKLAPLSRCEVAAEETLAVFHVHGEFPEERTGTPAGACADFPWDGKTSRAFRSDRLGREGCDVFVASEDAARFAAALASRGARELSPSEVGLLRVKNGVPLVGRDVTEDNLPQEGGLNAALHFNKGCYLGQETVARLHYRGHVNRSLERLVCRGGDVSSAAEIRDAAGQPLGPVTSAAYDAADNATYFLAYLPARAEGGGFFADGRPVSKSG